MSDKVTFTFKSSLWATSENKIKKLTRINQWGKRATHSVVEIIDPVMVAWNFLPSKSQARPACHQSPWPSAWRMAREQWGEEGRQWAFPMVTVNACLPSFSVEWLSNRFVYLLIMRWNKAAHLSMNNFDSLNYSWFQVSLNLILKLRNSQTKSFIYGFTLAESYFSVFWL